MFQEFIAPAFSYGVSAAAIPGPLIAYLVNTTLAQGWRKALLVVAAPLLTDAPIILLTTFILGHLPGEALKLIQIGGGCLLLYIAWGAGRQHQAGRMLNHLPEQGSGAKPAYQILLTGILMNFLSPGPWLFWATINGPLLVEALNVDILHALAFLATFYGTFLSGLCGWVLLFHRARKVRAEYLRYVILATILLLLWFGAGLITSGIGLGDLSTSGGARDCRRRPGPALVARALARAERHSRMRLGPSQGQDALRQRLPVCSPSRPGPQDCSQFARSY